MVVILQGDQNHDYNFLDSVGRFNGNWCCSYDCVCNGGQMMNPLIMSPSDLIRYVKPSNDVELALHDALKEVYATIEANRVLDSAIDRFNLI